MAVHSPVLQSVALPGQVRTSESSNAESPGEPELAVTSEPVTVRELVEDFSCWRDYADAVVAAAESSGVATASTMLVFHWVEFDPKKSSSESERATSLPGQL